MTDREVLPTTVRPRHYALSIFDLNFSEFTYKGTVKIDLDVIGPQPVSEIQLNVREITVTEAAVSLELSKTSSEIKVLDIVHDTKSEIVTLTLSEPVPIEAGRASLTVLFSGFLNNKMAGFYRSKYTDTEGKDSYMYSTQFEATDARRAFPCFDEPALKATFDFSITIPEDLTALSNMPVVSSKIPEDGKKAGEAGSKLKTVSFATTPLMSTYLLAWAVGDFEYIEALTAKSYTGKKVLVRVYTTKGLKRQGEFALENATKIVDYFSELFDIDYVLPKVDLLAVHEFSHGAMENWGLITYRTTALLFDPETSDSKYKKRVAYVVAHELAHQWFGNLVTMDWWSELWLNEGFATWVGWLAIDYLYPDWDVFSTFVTESLQRALDLDSLRQSHPIEVPVKSGLDIDQIFDAISYLKGASSIRMISSYLGVKTFIKGVSRYLKEHAYGNAVTADLWKAVGEESGVDVNTIMAEWITKIGFPVITVSESESGVTLRQDRFISSGDVTPEENQATWWIPLGIYTDDSSASAYSSISSFTNKETVINGLNSASFYKLNKDQTGVYRVNYPSERLAKIGMANDKLSASDKVGLIADASAIALAGLSSTTGILGFLDGLKGEDSYVVWSEIASRLGTLRSVWFEQPEHVTTGLAAFAGSLVSPVVKKLGWDSKPGEGYLDLYLRSLALGVAGSANDKEVVAEAILRFNKYVAGDKKAISPDIRRVVFATVIGTLELSNEQSASAFDAVYEEALNPSSIDGKEIALSALGRTKRPELIKKALDLLLSGKVAVQDVHTLAASLAANGTARWPLWNFIKENWDTIYGALSGNMVVLDLFIRASITSFSSQEAYDDIKNFFADKDTHGYERSLGQALDVIGSVSKWVERDAEPVEIWLKEQGYIA
ncbi:peptidase family M1-domain-containing protein [Lipomyces japonicus]|uniref:peptidase family M1-domain-containing protein n=1 Tax=Lipomyces japonicus TaxID=56871 RepID=UPI0034CE587E